jgi:hypothetical protein
LYRFSFENVLDRKVFDGCSFVFGAALSGILVFIIFQIFIRELDPPWYKILLISRFESVYLTFIKRHFWLGHDASQVVVVGLNLRVVLHSRSIWLNTQLFWKGHDYIF